MSPLTLGGSGVLFQEARLLGRWGWWRQLETPDYVQGAVGTLGGQEKGERGPGETGPAEASHQGSVHLRLRGRPRPSRALFGLCSICFSVSLYI